MERNKLLLELKTRFEELKEELKFKAAFEDINSIFFLEDHILHEGFISNQFSRQVCSRILETYNGWAGYLHNLIMPNPGNIASMMETKLMDEKEKKEIGELFKKCMALSSENAVIGLTKDKKKEAEFIDEAVNFWKSCFKNKLIEILKKVNENWKK
jgi:hypothetical protein